MGCKYIRDCVGARIKLETANKFFRIMETRGLMKGARVFPIGVYYEKASHTYKMYLKREPKG
jgi:hypothetical protein